MNREVHVRFWESLGVRFPWATQLHVACEGLDSLGHCDARALACNPYVTARLKHVRRLNPVGDDADDLWKSFSSVKKHLAARCTSFTDCLCSGVCREAVDHSLAFDRGLGSFEKCEVRRWRPGNLPTLRTMAGELDDWLVLRRESEAAASARCYSGCDHEVWCPCEA